jgi:hypothetical protein
MPPDGSLHHAIAGNVATIVGAGGITLQGVPPNSFPAIPLGPFAFDTQPSEGVLDRPEDREDRIGEPVDQLEVPGRSESLFSRCNDGHLDTLDRRYQTGECLAREGGI